MSHADLSERPRRERDPLKGRRRALGFASALAAAVLLYAAFGFLLAPRLIERYLPQRLEAALGQPVALGTVSVNPFTFAVRARDVRIGGRDGDAPIALGALLLDFDPFASGFGRGWVLGDVRVDGARIRAQLDRAGRLDLAQLLAGRGEARGGGKPPRVVLRHVLVDAAVELRVVSGEKPEAIDAGPVHIEALDVATGTDGNGRYTASARLGDGAVLDWHGDLDLQPARSAGEISVKGVKLGTLWPLLRDRVEMSPPRGTVDASARYRFSAERGAPDLALEAVQLSARDIAIPGADGAPLFSAASVAVDGGSMDLSRRALAAERVSLERGRVGLVRDENGAFTLPRLPRESSGGGDRPWTYSVKAARASGFTLALADRSFSPALAYGLEDVAVEARNLARASERPVDIEAKGRIAAGGSFSLRGTAPQDFATAQGELELRDAALAPLQPAIARIASVRLESGTASAAMHVEYRGAQAQPALEARGRAGLADVEMKDAATGERVLAWQSLDADAARLTLAPAVVAAKQIVLDRAHVRIAISRDRKLNLAQLVKSGAPGEAKAGADRVSLRIGGVRVRRSTVNFSDESLVLPFSAGIYGLHGDAIGLTSAPGRRATLELDGKIGKFGSASARGRLDVGNPARFTDIAVDFGNVDMPPLSPYSATFLGRKIAGGELWLDLDYRVERGELQGRNQVTISNLALGERVDAPNALDVPIDLLVGLLTDSQGRLRVDVPVTGDVNDPKFDLRAVIRAQVASFARRVVTAPFRAIAGLLGGRGRGGESKELQDVTFDPGSARLTPGERENLQEVAKALAARPRLAVVVPAPYDPERDAGALKDEAVRRELAHRLGRPAAPHEDPGPVGFGSPATQHALEQMLEERSGPDAVRTLAGWFRDDTGREPERVNAFLRRPGDPKFYRSVFERLVSGQPLDGDAARSLASRRAQAVIGALRAQGVDPRRLSAGDIQIAHGERNEIPAPLALRAAGAGQTPAG